MYKIKYSNAQQFAEDLTRMSQESDGTNYIDVIFKGGDIYLIATSADDMDTSALILHDGYKEVQ